jgi:hypothetical protein
MHRIDRYVYTPCNIYTYKHIHTQIYIYLYIYLYAPQVLNFSERIPRDLLFIIRTQNLVRALCSDLVSLSLARARSQIHTHTHTHTHTNYLSLARSLAHNITRAYKHTCMYVHACLYD